MKLQVNVLEARGLAAKDADGSSDPYVKLQLGRTKSSTSVVRKCLNPSWNEEFSFRVDDLESEVLITVWDEDAFTDDFLGQVKLPVSRLLHADKLTLPPAWYQLQKRSSKSKTHVSGEILLSFSLYGRTSNAVTSSPPYNELMTETTAIDSSPDTPRSSSSIGSPSRGRQKAHHLRQKISALFTKAKKPRIHPNTFSDQSHQSTSEDGDSSDEDEVPLSFFEEESTAVVPSNDGLPPPLPGGILLDQTYAATVKALNSILFKPGSSFLQDLIVLQKTIDLVEGSWKKIGNENPRRVLTYMKAPTKLVKSVKATEEQTYLRADDKGYVVLASVDTPDVPYGSNFRTEIQYCMTPDLSASGQENCHLCISWRMNFLHNTMMKNMIENGARQGLKESFEQYAEVLSKYVKGMSDDENASRLEKDPLEVQPKSDRELVVEYLCNPVVIMTFTLLFLILLHIYLSNPSMKGGLEFWELDLPDSLSELLVSAVLALQLEKIMNIALKFLHARVCVAGDHGIKAKGEGWLLTVTLVEGENLPIAEDASCLDPYVVFTCSGRSRTSSVKLQTTTPKWSEIFEFDATEDPPSTLDVEVFNYDGPFPEAESLGFAEINFLKHSSQDLADIWVNLAGKRAQACGSRLHLRIFLTNTKESDTFVEYVKKVEKEVGTKIWKRSTQRNSSFQKLFSLPAEEFLINDFACAIKRKIPLQGRLFLSPRMLGFYSNIFGHKTKFSLLWEDIEEVQELPPSLANVGPSVVVFTRKGRAHDANQGAKSVDGKGRLKFQFQSFVRPGPAFRTLMVLWKSRTLTPEQQIEMVENVEADKLSDGEGQGDDNGDFLGVEDAKLTEVYSTNLPFTAASMILLYERENLEEKIKEKAGCTNYTASPWESVSGKASVQQRQANYKFNRRLCQFGSTVTGIQQKEVSEDRKVVALDEILTLHDVPFGDHFQIQVRKEIQTLSLKPPVSSCKVYVGIVWQKGTHLQTRITSNVYDQFTKHLKEEVALSVKEILSYKDHHAYVLV